MRILLAQINPTIGDIKGNTEKILLSLKKGKQLKTDIVLFSELALCGYPPDDFLLLPHFLSALNPAIETIKQATVGITAVVGLPRIKDAKLYNSAAIFSNGELLGYQDKTLLPTYDVFFERRYFEPATESPIWKIAGKKVGITICEDIWKHSAAELVSYSQDPVLRLAKEKPDCVLNLSASPYSINKFARRLQVCCQAALTLKCPLLLCNQVGGNDGLIFDGRSLYVGAQGDLKQYSKGFQEDHMLVDLSEKISSHALPEVSIQELYDALVLGIRDYFHKSGFTKACLGLSGGIDSAVVACLAVEALGKKNVLGIAMPSRFSSPHSLEDAKGLAKHLGIDFRVIPIEAPFQSYLDILVPNFEGRPEDTTEENIQARIRGMILMALSNKLGHIVLSTGNKSEMAMGYATLYGDMCGGLGVINDVSKRQVYALAHWINREREIIPQNTILKPPSAELRPNQKDSDSLPEYDIVDNVLEAYVENHFSPEEIAKRFQYSQELVNSLVKKIHCSEYKRRQSPPGLRVTEKAFTAGRRFPIVQRFV